MNDASIEGFEVATLPYAWGGPCACGLLKQETEDFQVMEDLGFTPSGDGDHLLVHVRKRQLTTTEVAKRLARHCGVRAADVGYAGLKDRHAMTSQWFTVLWPGKGAPDLDGLTDTTLEILDITRNRRKLRRGALAGNRFRLRLREVTTTPAVLEARLRELKVHGFPNYFGEQRFGDQQSNVRDALHYLRGHGAVSRFLHGLYLSTLRSHLFNQVLARRVLSGTWNRGVPGDVLQLDGRGSVFLAEAIDPDLESRLGALQLHPTGPLAGRPAHLLPLHDVAALEHEVLAPFAEIISWLGTQVDADRRALRARPSDMEWQLEGDCLQLAFGLPAGAYATTLVRELIG